MVRPSQSAGNASADQPVPLTVSLLSRPLRRQVSSLILLLSVICAPVHINAQSKEQEKRGLGIQPTPTPTATSVTPANPGDKPELILQSGHTKSANAVAFSPDNRWLASGGKDNVIKIWDLTNGNVLRTLYGHTSNVNALAVSPDGKLLASGSGDINDERDLGTFTQGGVVGGAQDNTVRIWSVQTGRQLQVFTRARTACRGGRFQQRRPLAYQRGR